MNAARTEKAFTADVSAELREVFRRSLHDTRTSAALLAALVGLNGSRVERWYSDAHAPLYLLAHARVPLALRVRLMSECLRIVGEYTGPRSSAENATAVLISIASECLALAGRALADGRVDDTERRELRPLVARLRDWCDRWLRDHGDAPAASRAGESAR
jgi:hypothetical protein